MNFIKLYKAVHRYACDEELGDDEYILLYALFSIYNDRLWPSGIIGITTNQLLNETQFVGSHRDDKLRSARQKLANRGILTYIPGEAYKARAQYSVDWDRILAEYGPQDDRTPSETCTENGTESARNLYGNCAENRPYIYENQNQEINQDPDPSPSPEEINTHSVSQPEFVTRAREGWFDPEHPERGDDGAWRFSRSARLATAQRIVNSVKKKLVCINDSVDDGIDEHIITPATAVDEIATAMACGITPTEIVDEVSDCMFIPEWMLAIRRKAIWRGNAPPEWCELRQAINDHLVDLRDPQERARHRRFYHAES